MTWRICPARTMSWSTALVPCATANGAPPGGGEPLPLWWCAGRCECSRLWPCDDSVFYHDHWLSLIQKRGTACVSSSPFGARRVANNCASARTLRPTLRRWRRSCSRQACHPSFFEPSDLCAQSSDFCIELIQLLFVARFERRQRIFFFKETRQAG